MFGTEDMLKKYEEPYDMFCDTLEQMKDRSIAFDAITHAAMRILEACLEIAQKEARKGNPMGQIILLGLRHRLDEFWDKTKDIKIDEDLAKTMIRIRKETCQ